jgi:hypothetical protein
MQNLARVMGEPGQMNTIFLARDRLGVFAFLDIKNLNCFIVTGRYHMLALVVEVEGGHEV